MRKTCIQVFERLAGEWLVGAGEEALPGFREYIMKQVRAGGSGGVFSAIGVFQGAAQGFFEG